MRCPLSAQIGSLKSRSVRVFSAFFVTPTEVAVATLSINISLLRSGWIFSGDSPSPATMWVIKLTLMETLEWTSGRSPFRATTWPERLSEVVMEGSRNVAIPQRPPACMVFKFNPPPCMLLTTASIGSQVALFPFLNFSSRPDNDGIAFRKLTFNDAASDDTPS